MDVHVPTCILRPGSLVVVTVNLHYNAPTTHALQTIGVNWTSKKYNRNDRLAVWFSAVCL